MSVSVAGFKSSEIFEQIKSGLEQMPAATKQETIKKVNGVFEMVVKAGGKEQSWTLDFKKGSVSVGKPEGKSDITITLNDDVFLDLASGKINGQKAFMSGKLKVKGNMMLAMRLDTVLSAVKNVKPASKPEPKAAAKAVPGFESAALFSQMEAGILAASDAEKEQFKKKTKAIFQFDVKNKDGQVQTWTLNMKDKVELTTGPNGPKPDVTIAVADKDFVDMASGKLNGQKAFMSGKIKVKGAIMLATKLDGLLKELGPRAKL
ncbi:SCP2 sterol-binding domain-containing protein, partial [Gorgonomyces haynaldii]